jgi:hypothetical protein
MASNVAFTSEGKNFLQKATSSIDFPNIKSEGVPDSYAGNSLVFDQVFTGNIEKLPDKDLLLIIPPVPNLAFVFNNTSFGPNVPVTNPLSFTIWSPREFINSNTIFPGIADNGGITDNLVQFRYVSLTAELELVANPLTSAGTIAACRIPITCFLDTETGGASTILPLWSMNTVGSIDQCLTNAKYLKPVRDGAYAVATHLQPTWDFTPVRGNYMDSTGPGATVSDFESGVQFTPPRRVFPGWGEHQSLGFRVTAPSGTPAMQFVLKVYASIEYQVNETGVYLGLATRSPMSDPLALENYARANETMPVAVPAAQNSNFWETTLAGLSAAGGVLGTIPGPWGMVAKAVGMGAGAGASVLSSRRAARASQPKPKTNTRQGPLPLAPVTPRRMRQPGARRPIGSRTNTRRRIRRR